MKLNRERIAAGLSLLLLILGAYRLLSFKIGDAPPPISTDIPTMADPIPRVEPRLFVEDQGGDRNPFQLASDWAPMTPEPLEPPAVEPTRWIAMPLGKSPDPALVGFGYPIIPPQEIGGDDTGEVKEPAPKPPAPPPAPAVPPVVPPAAKSLKVKAGKAGR
jgi:hypothetical protein